MIKKILLTLILAMSLIGCSNKTDKEDVVVLLVPDDKTQEQVQDVYKPEIKIDIVNPIELTNNIYIDIAEPVIHLGDMDIKVGGTLDSLLNSGFILDDFNDIDINSVLKPDGYATIMLQLKDDENFPSDLIINASVVNNTTDELTYSQCNIVRLSVSSAYAEFSGEGVTEADTVFNLGQEIEAGFSNVRYGVKDFNTMFIVNIMDGRICGLYLESNYRGLPVEDFCYGIYNISDLYNSQETASSEMETTEVIEDAPIVNPTESVRPIGMPDDIRQVLEKYNKTDCEHKNREVAYEITDDYFCDVVVTWCNDCETNIRIFEDEYFIDYYDYDLLFEELQTGSTEHNCYLLLQEPNATNAYGADGHTYDRRYCVQCGKVYKLIDYAILTECNTDVHKNVNLVEWLEETYVVENDKEYASAQCPVCSKILNYVDFKLIEE